MDYEQLLENPEKIDEAFEQLRVNDMRTAMACNAVGSSSEIQRAKFAALLLAEHVSDLESKLLLAESIVPRRYRISEDTVARWDAPDELVPLQAT